MQDFGNARRSREVTDLKPGPAQLSVRIMHVFGSYSNIQYASCPVITVQNADLSQERAVK
jgi:hypothetical protein